MPGLASDANRCLLKHVRKERPVSGLEPVTVDVIVAEPGADMARFRSASDLASWAGVCPGNHESAGKRRRVATTPGNQWLRRGRSRRPGTTVVDVEERTRKTVGSPSLG